MITAMEAAHSAGVDIKPLDFWRRDADFDVLHLWGLDAQHRSTAKWARAGKKKIVLTALVNYPGWYSWLRHKISATVGPARMRKSLLADIDCITVVNHGQKQYLTGTVGLPGEKVFVVPNVVDDIFFDVSDHPKEGSIGLDKYVLCVGNICPRKNQLALVKASRKLGVPVVLVGDVLTGEEDYGRAVVEAMAGYGGSRWVKGLRPGSRELADIYLNSAVFALPSHLEQQPIAALEAAACRKPLVLANKPYARQDLYQNAALAAPDSVDAIAEAIRKALDRPAAFCPPVFALEQCRRDNVGAAYHAIYRQLVHESDQGL